MDLINNKACIISAGIGGWYPIGIKRLKRSLNFVGSPFVDILWDNEYPPNCPDHNEVPYYFKIAAFDEAIRSGYTKILWLDSSFWAVKSPMPLFDIINDQGYYMFSSGYSMAQTISDRALVAEGISRDEIDGMPEWASGCVGLNLDNPEGIKLYEGWKTRMKAGLSIGSRLHDNQSHDPRFLFHRQDQSCLSLAIRELGLKNTQGLDYVAYHGTGYNIEQVIFFIQGV